MPNTIHTVNFIRRGRAGGRHLRNWFYIPAAAEALHWHLCWWAREVDPTLVGRVVEVRFVREGCKRAALVNTFSIWVPKDSSDADEAASTAMCAIIRQAFPEGPEPSSNANYTAYVQVSK
jgi:hypothetical protein